MGLLSGEPGIDTSYFVGSFGIREKKGLRGIRIEDFTLFSDEFKGSTADKIKAIPYCGPGSLLFLVTKKKPKVKGKSFLLILSPPSKAKGASATIINEKCTRLVSAEMRGKKCKVHLNLMPRACFPIFELSRQYANRITDHPANREEKVLGKELGDEMEKWAGELLGAIIKLPDLNDHIGRLPA